jgi:hypothetical protein
MLANNHYYDLIALWWGREPVLTLPEPEPIDVWLSKRGFAV